MTKPSRLILYLLFALSILLVSFLRLPESKYSTTSDEGYYYHYAWQVAQKGLDGFKDAVRWYVASEEARYHPAPTRIGYVFLSAFLFKVLGPSYEVLGLISLFSFLGFLGICFHFLRRYFDEVIAFPATVLLSSSPLLLALSRRALVDSLVVLTWTLSFWLFFEFVRKPKIKQYSFFLLSMTYALLVKESAIILIVFFVIFLFLTRKDRSQPIRRVYFWGIVLGPLILSGTCFVAATGGWGNAFSAIDAILVTHFDPQHSNFYAMKLSAGPWYRYIIDFLLLSPITTLLFVGYFFSLAREKTKSLIEKYFLLYFIVLFAFFNMLPHTKVVRFVASLEMIIAVFAVLYIHEFWKKTSVRWSEGLILISVLALFVINWIDFHSIFLKTDLLDPISFHLLQIRKFIP